MSESPCQPTQNTVQTESGIENLVCGVCWKDVSPDDGLQTLENDHRNSIQIALGILASKSEIAKFKEAEAICSTCTGCSKILENIYDISSQIKRLEADLMAECESLGKRVCDPQDEDRTEIMKKQFSDSFCTEWRKFSFQLFVRYTYGKLETLPRGHGNIGPVEEQNESTGRNLRDQQNSEQRKRRRSGSRNPDTATVENDVVSVASSSDEDQLVDVKTKKKRRKTSGKRPRNTGNAHKVLDSEEGKSEGEHTYQCPNCVKTVNYGSGSESLRQARMKIAAHTLAEHDFPETKGLNGNHPLYIFEDGKHFFRCNFQDCDKKFGFDNLKNRNKSKKFKEHLGSHYLTENEPIPNHDVLIQLLF